ncbi:MAG: DUF3500 domain-containing protein, partial [Dehalococcoidia bacterium]
MQSTAAVMMTVARDFLASLEPAQQAQAQVAFHDDERFNWHFTPRMRRGLPLRHMDAAQRHLAHALLSTGVSARGYVKAATIMSLESVLRELEGGLGYLRDPDLYYFTVFGTPTA